MEYTQVNNLEVYGLKESIRGAKFPMCTDLDKLNYDLTDGIKKLAQSKAGEGHDNWLCGIIAQFDLTFSNKAWVEIERYHFVDFVSSQSTMHRICKFDIEKMYNNYVDPRLIEIMKEKVAEYNSVADYIKTLSDGDEKTRLVEEQKERYLGVLYSNPAGFLLTARLSVNYRQLKTIYTQRKAHRLPEWREFCKWIETLPNSELITGDINI